MLCTEMGISNKCIFLSMKHFIIRQINSQSEFALVCQFFQSIYLELNITQ